ncbi:MAG: dCMP deaminase family protein [Rhodospirillaceae bacterium]|nr:dCMP deaminase family protein [Rhodospirillaceae bacterium]
MYTNGIVADHAAIMKFITFFMSQAYNWASLSKDPSTKVGAVAVQGDQIVCSGWNGFPRGVNDDPVLLNNREEKYPRIIHAEQNVITNAAREGIRLRDAVLICTHHPCPTCSGLIIQAGFRSIIFDAKTFTDDFRMRLKTAIAEENFAKAQIPVVGIDYKPD